MRFKSKLLGFSLLEIMIVTVIIGVLATLSVPVFSKYFLRENRFAAETSLLKLAAALEQYYLQTNSYEHATLTSLGFPAIIVSGQYQLDIASTTANNFTLTATPLAQQTADTTCATLTLNAAGEKNITGNGTAGDCW